MSSTETLSLKPAPAQLRGQFVQPLPSPSCPPRLEGEPVADGCSVGVRLKEETLPQVRCGRPAQAPSEATGEHLNTRAWRGFTKQ